jgi:hypothetical protein
MSKPSEQRKRSARVRELLAANPSIGYTEIQEAIRAEFGIGISSVAITKARRVLGLPVREWQFHG